MASQETSCLGDGISREDYLLLVKSFKDKKFRELLCDYAREVNDPDNRKQFEKEVIEYEKERGVEAVFLHPSPGFALIVQCDGESAFVNICSSDRVQKPDIEAVSTGDRQCHKWILPHAVPKPRREVVVVAAREEEQAAQCGSPPHSTRQVEDHVKQKVVHDVVFHPDALYLALHSPGKKQTLIDTAMDSLRKHFSVQISEVKEVNDKQYIGVPAQCIIRRKIDKKHESDERHTAYKDHRTNAIDDKVVSVSEGKLKDKESKLIEPKYKLKYVRKMDIQDFSLQLIPQCSTPWKPQALEVEVNLPGVSRALQVTADIRQQSVHLTTDSNPKYKLELPLRYPVDEEHSAAKFDVSTQKLTLTLPVVPSNKNSDKLGSQGQSPPSDSGIECELDYPTNGDSDNVPEEPVSSQDGGTKDIGATETVEEDSVFEPSSLQQMLTIAPNYTLQQTKEILYIFLCCGNVLPRSIQVEQIDGSSAKIELSSIGGGQTLLHYSLEVDVNPYKIAASDISHKFEDGKVVFIVKKAMADLWKTCKISHGDSVTIVNLPTGIVGDASGKSENESTGEKQDSSTNCTCVSRAPRMARTVSMCETEAGHPFRLRGPTCSWPRGILKRRVRSLSESQIGILSSSAPIAHTSASLDLDVFENKPMFCDEDEGDESVEESVVSSLGEKKSVRFNEVVSRQLFRSNSSILGQRAKNQRKAIRKRKSQARREPETEKDVGINMSESASGDSDLTTDAATDDDTDATNSNTTEVEDCVDVESYAANSKGNGHMNTCGSVLQPLKESNKNNNVHKSIKNNMNHNININNNNDNNNINNNCNNDNSNNNNDNSDDNSTNNSGDNDNFNRKSNEEDDNSDFILKTNKKKKRKNRKNKVPTFEPTNTLIFQLDMDK